MALCFDPDCDLKDTVILKASAFYPTLARELFLQIHMLNGVDRPPQKPLPQPPEFLR